MDDVTLQEVKVIFVADDKGSKTIQDITKNLTQMNNAVNNIGKTMSKNQSTYQAHTNVLAKIESATQKTKIAIQRFTTVCSEWFKESNDYVEALNLFEVSMGKSTKAASEFATSIQDLMGIDLKEWMNYQGSFNQMLEGFGISDNLSAQMSQQLTQISYDLSSLWNTDVETAFQKVQSGVSGQIKGLKVWGINLSVAQLKETALAHGIELSTSKMTEAQKATLRYITIMEKTQNVQGDLARTIITPANAMRVLSAQAIQLKRALGNIASVLIVDLIPAVQLATKWLTELANKLAKAMGYELPQIDYSGIQNATGSFGDMEDSMSESLETAKKLKKSLMGFDELNVLQAPTSSNDTSLGGGLPDDLGIDLSQYGYDFTKGLRDLPLDEAKEKLKDIFWHAGAIGAALLAWNIGTTIGQMSLMAGGLGEVATMLKTVLGIAMAVAGAILLAKGALDAWNNGVDWKSFFEMLGGAALLVGGLALAFGGIGAAIGGIVGGVVLMIVGIKDAITNGINEINALIIGIGGAMLGAGIGFLVGGPAGAAIGALIGLAVGLITDFVIWLVQNWDEVSAWFSETCTKIGEFFSGLWEGIKEVWSNVTTWFNDTIITPITEFFSNLWTSISTWASNCWENIKTFFSPAIEWFSELFGSIWQTISDIFYDIGIIAKGCWEIIEYVWGIVSDWFDKNIIQPVSTFFTNLWSSISTWAINAWNNIVAVFSTISNWINVHIIQPVSTFFTNLWNGFLDKAKSAWKGVKEVFSTVASFFKDTFSKAWQGVIKVFSVAGEIFVKIKDGILSGFKWVVNNLIRGINNVVAIPFNGLNSAIATIRSLSIGTIQPFEGLRDINVPQIPLLASGGIVDTGQMFIAREGAPELVGTIGNKSAVVNNDQIVESVEGGVFRGVMAALQNSHNGNGNGRAVIEAHFYLDGQEITDNVIEHHNDYVKANGSSPLLIGG